MRGKHSCGRHAREMARTPIAMLLSHPKPPATRQQRHVSTITSRTSHVRCHAQRQPNLAEKVALLSAAVSAAVVPTAQATDAVASASALPFALGSGAAIVGLGVLLVNTDPQKRWGIAAVQAVGSSCRQWVPVVAAVAAACGDGSVRCAAPATARRSSYPARPYLTLAGGLSRWPRPAAMSWRR